MRYLLLFMVVVLMGCEQFMPEKRNDKVIAEVGNDQLYLSRLVDHLPAFENPTDSILFAQNYIEKWVRNQLLLDKSIINLDQKTQDEIDDMVANYRTSLMIFKYQQKLIMQKLDTVVTEDQINNYYEKNAGNFKLDSSVVKAIYVKVTKSTYDAQKIRRWIRSRKEEDLISLEDYCYQNARNFKMGEQWMYFGGLLSNTPRTIQDHDKFLRNNKNIEAQDDLCKYYISILDYKLTNDTTPLVFVKSKIRDVIINRRKVKFIRDLENNVYGDAVNQKQFTIHTN